MIARSPAGRSRARMLGLAVWLGVVGVPAAPAQTAATFAGNPIAGRQIFVERGCVSCHSIWGNGGSLGPDLALVGAGRSLQQLAGLFWNHTPRMIESVRLEGLQWPQFSETDLANIISYIYYVKLFDEPGDPEAGERAFREKMCYSCHVVGGVGNAVGSALDDYANHIAPIHLAAGMWNSGPAMRDAQSGRGIGSPVFDGHELTDIQAFIRRNSRLRDREIVFLQPPDPNSGRDLFRSKGCSRCHGPMGRGTSVGPDLRASTERLHVSEIAGRLWNHSYQMAASMRSMGVPFPRFKADDLADVISFLYYLRFYDSGGDLSAGESAFRQKGCAACHAVAEGSPRAPDLSLSQAIRTPLGLATAMWNHAPAMYDLIQLEHWPRFEGEEMRDLSVYLRSLVAEP